MDRLEKQRMNRIKNNNAWTKKYEKTHKGFLVRLYRNMKSRVEGVQWRKAHLYKGKYLLDKATFYEWALNSPEFLALFEEWKKSEYSRKLTPSVDRVDSSLGYTLPNMEWVTFSENCRRAGLAKKSRQVSPS